MASDLSYTVFVEKRRIAQVLSQADAALLAYGRDSVVKWRGRVVFNAKRDLAGWGVVRWQDIGDVISRNREALQTKLIADLDAHIADLDARIGAKS